MRTSRKLVLGAAVLAAALAAACSSGGGSNAGSTTPATVAALRSGAVQVGELFSTSVYDPDFVVLTDDKHLEAADNITPVVRTKVATSDVQTLLNAVSAKLTTDGMLALNKMVDIDHQDPAAVAQTFLQQQGLLPAPTTSGARRRTRPRAAS